MPAPNSAAPRNIAPETPRGEGFRCITSIHLPLFRPNVTAALLESITMMPQSQTVDPITAELVQARLTSIVREMRTIIIRTAYSRMIIEGHDFSSAVLTPQGDLVAASELEQPRTSPRCRGRRAR
jgi:hypothetical protein